MFLFHASEVAALIGRHKYQNQRDMMLKYLKALDKSAYERHASVQDRVITKRTTDGSSERQITVSVPNEQAAKGRILYESLRSEITCDVKCMVTVPSTTTEVRDAAQQMAQALDDLKAKNIIASGLSDEDIHAMKEYCKSSIYGVYGTTQEANVIRSYEADIQSKVTKDNVYKKRRMCMVRSGDGTMCPVYIGGKCDGVSVGNDGKKTLLEVKNRVNRLFNCVPEYEKIQVFCYLYIYGIAEATVVERFQGQTVHHLIAFDQDYWEEIETGVTKAAIELDKLMEKPVIQAQK